MTDDEKRKKLMELLDEISKLGQEMTPPPYGCWEPPPVQKCAFDGLPPGAYNLVCFCPRCTPRC